MQVFLNKLVFLIYVIVIVAVASESNNDLYYSTWGNDYDTDSGLPEDFENEITKFIVGGNMTTSLQLYIDSMDDRFKQELDEEIFEAANWLTCPLCQSTAFALIVYVRLGGSNEHLRELAINMCKKTGYDTDVCGGLIDLNLPIFVYIIKHKPTLTAKKMCKIIAQPVCINQLKPTNWEVNTHTDVPKKSVPIVEDPDKKPLKILHITDVHYDPKYKMGANAVCSKPSCCRDGEGEPKNSEDAAGMWGDYRGCDGPIKALENALDEITKNHSQIDWVYFTGDIVSHNVWDTTFEQVNGSIHLIYDILKQSFGNTSIFPTLGNHETQPLDQYAPNTVNESFSTRWLFELVSELWSPWLPESSRKTLMDGGFYSVKVRDNFRVIALNNNVCYTFNWWLLLNTVDPYDQLQWLADELLNAEKDGEFIHLLGHIPVGDSTCEVIWQKVYREIISRFSHIIKGQFVGHSHRDEIRIIYDPINTTQVIGASFNGGGITTWTNANPNFRMFTVNPDSYDIIDYDQWVYNLTEANLSLKPEWYKLYSFKAAYNVKSLLPENLHVFAEKLATNATMLDQYIRFKGKNSDPYTLNACYDEKCRDNELCKIVTSVYNDNNNCRNILDFKRRS